MPYKPEHRLRTRKKILESAQYLFSHYGAEKTSIGDIMERAELTHGGFYNHFSSKDELLAQVIHDSVSLSKLANVPQEKEEKEKWLDQVLRSYLSLEHASRKTFACPLTFLARDVSLGTFDAKHEYEELLRQHISKIIEHFLDHKSSKEAKSSSYSVTALMLGALNMASAVNNNNLAEEILESARESVKNILRM